MFVQKINAMSMFYNEQSFLILLQLKYFKMLVVQDFSGHQILVKETNYGKLDITASMLLWH